MKRPLAPEAKKMIKHAHKLRRKMRAQLRVKINDAEEAALCRLLKLGNQDYYTFNHLPMYESNVDDALIRKLELLSGPNAYAMLRAMIAREEVV
jgi:hypothetical protein